jgi:hypothetical protein
MAREPQGCTRSSAKRWLIGGVAGLSLVTQLAALGHLVLVRHSTCPEHGELVHGDHATGSHVASAGGQHAASPRAALRAREQTVLDADEHCDVLAHRREYVDLPVFEALASPIATQQPHPRAEPAVLHASAARIYAQAPKTSPPSA